VSYNRDINWCPILKKVEGILSEKNQERDVYVAIADPTRRKLLSLLADAEELPLHELTAQFQMGRTAVSKHLAILKEAGLVDDRKVGRETRYRLNAAPLQEIKDWVSFYEKFWKENVALLKNLLGEE
jgi:DNA-binding transcriptional ArsR family regulator